jgi:hypothetical protein
MKTKVEPVGLLVLVAVALLVIAAFRTIVLSHLGGGL